MDCLDDALTVGRGFGLRIQWFLQSMAQLMKCVPDGQDQNFLANTTQVFAAVQDYPTSEYISFLSLGAKKPSSSRAAERREGNRKQMPGNWRSRKHFVFWSIPAVTGSKTRKLLGAGRGDYSGRTHGNYLHAGCSAHSDDTGAVLLNPGPKHGTRWAEIRAFLRCACSLFLAAVQINYSFFTYKRINIISGDDYEKVVKGACFGYCSRRWP